MAIKNKSVATRQLSLDFDPGLTERHDSLLACVRACAERHQRPLKAIAADMDLSVSDLSRKLAGRPDDKRRFSVDDLERFIETTGDVTPIQWLVERFIESSDSKRARALAELARVLPDVVALVKSAGVK